MPETKRAVVVMVEDESWRKKIVDLAAASGYTVDSFPCQSWLGQKSFDSGVKFLERWRWPIDAIVVDSGIVPISYIQTLHPQAQIIFIQGPTTI